MYSETDNNLKVLNKKVQNDGGIIEGSPEDSLIQAYSNILSSREAAEAHHDNVMNTIQTTVNLQDAKALKRRADDIIAYNGFRTEIWNAANEYAMGTAKQELNVDPYSMENVKFNHEKQLKDYDFDPKIPYTSTIDIYSVGKTLSILITGNSWTSLPASFSQDPEIESLIKDCMCSQAFRPNAAELEIKYSWLQESSEIIKRTSNSISFNGPQEINQLQ